MTAQKVEEAVDGRVWEWQKKILSLETSIKVDPLFLIFSPPPLLLDLADALDVTLPPEFTKVQKLQKIQEELIKKVWEEGKKHGVLPGEGWLSNVGIATNVEWGLRGIDERITLPPGGNILLYGKSGSGKTQLSMFFAARRTKHGTVVYVDTEKTTLMPSTYATIKKYGGDPGQIYACRPQTPIGVLLKATSAVRAAVDKGVIAAIIVDSVNGPFRLLADQEEGLFGVKRMTTKVSQTVEFFKNLAFFLRAPILMTAQVYESPPPNPNLPPQVKIFGGGRIEHFTNVRILLTKSKAQNLSKKVEAGLKKIKVAKKRATLIKGRIEQGLRPEADPEVAIFITPRGIFTAEDLILLAEGGEKHG